MHNDYRIRHGKIVLCRSLSMAFVEVLHHLLAPALHELPPSKTLAMYRDNLYVKIGIHSINR
jgi:hypothetical protein